MLQRIMHFKQFRRRTESGIMRIPQINYGFRESVVSVRDIMIRLGYKTPIQIARGEMLQMRTNLVREMDIQRVMARQARNRIQDTIGRRVDRTG